MNNGKLVPSEVTCRLLKKCIESTVDAKDKIFLIDGFPRNLENIQVWEQIFEKQSKILCVLFLDCPLDICLERLVERSKENVRPDDKVEIIKKRFKGFEETNFVVLDYMEKSTKIIKVDTQGKKEEIFEEICQKFAKENILQN